LQNSLRLAGARRELLRPFGCTIQTGDTQAAEAMRVSAQATLREGKHMSGSDHHGGGDDMVARGRAVELGYRNSILRMRLLISSSLTFAGLFLWALAGWGTSSFDGILGAIVTIYFGAKTLFNLNEVLFPRPVVVITPNGIHDRRLGAEPIPWSAIQQIKQVPGGKVGGGTLFLEVADPGRYIGPSKGLLWLIYLVRGLSTATTRRTGFLPMTPPVALDLGAKSLMDHLQAHAPRRIPVS
jgi:hypothetical protein